MDHLITKLDTLSTTREVLLSLDLAGLPEALKDVAIFKTAIGALQIKCDAINSSAASLSRDVPPSTLVGATRQMIVSPSASPPQQDSSDILREIGLIKALIVNMANAPAPQSVPGARTEASAALHQGEMLQAILENLTMSLSSVDGRQRNQNNMLKAIQTRLENVHRPFHELLVLLSPAKIGVGSSSMHAPSTPISRPSERMDATENGDLANPLLGICPAIPAVPKTAQPSKRRPGPFVPPRALSERIASNKRDRSHSKDDQEDTEAVSRPTKRQITKKTKIQDAAQSSRQDQQDVGGSLRQRPQRGRPEPPHDAASTTLTTNPSTDIGGVKIANGPSEVDSDSESIEALDLRKMSK